MSEGPTAAGAAQRVGSGTIRLVRAWRALPHESRLAACASGALFITLFFPWYQVTLIARARSSALESASASITGWGAFSFAEAVILLVAAGVVVLLFQRAEGRAFHLPGGDGAVITAAGLWCCLLIVWRIFDKQGATTSGPSTTTSGIEWGIFVALGAAGFLAYSGSRIRAAHRPEPPLPGEAGPPVGSSAAATPVVRPPRRRVNAPDLFERVVPDDPPTMRFGRAKPADVNPSFRKPEPPPPPAPVRAPGPDKDEQLTIPFADHEDATLPLASDHRSRPGDEATLPLGEDATLPLGEDATLPLGEDATLPLGEDATLPLGDEATLPLGEDATVRLGDDDTRPLDR